LKIQSRAAPMPRFGSVWVDSVCRVPKLDRVLDPVGVDVAQDGPQRGVRVLGTVEPTRAVGPLVG
jgi:hypothetical protein